MDNYNSIKWYEKDGEFVVELLIEVSDIDHSQGSSEIVAFKTQEEQHEQIKAYLAEAL